MHTILLSKYRELNQLKILIQRATVLILFDHTESVSVSGCHATIPSPTPRILAARLTKATACVP